MKMDKWKPKELKCMELGGNKTAMAYYEKNGMIQTDGKPNHKAPQLAKYKHELAKKAEQALGTIITMTSNVQPVVKVEQPEDNNPFLKMATSSE